MSFFSRPFGFFSNENNLDRPEQKLDTISHCVTSGSLCHFVLLLKLLLWDFANAFQSFDCVCEALLATTTAQCQFS